MIRKAEPEEIDAILAIYDKARFFMREHGNMTQWVNGYPSRELLEKDIAEGNLYVIEKDGIHAVFMFRVGHDDTYDVIRGEWIDDSQYGVIHRIGSDGVLHGVLHDALSFASSIISHIRIDTHSDNAVMRSALEKEGFSERGLIVCDDGTDRVAYERVLS